MIEIGIHQTGDCDVSRIGSPDWLEVMLLELKKNYYTSLKSFQLFDMRSEIKQEYQILKSTIINFFKIFHHQMKTIGLDLVNLYSVN